MLTIELYCLVFIAIIEHWSIIAGEDDDGILLEPQFINFVKNLTNAPVHFYDDIATHAVWGSASELRIWNTRYVRLMHRVV